MTEDKQYGVCADVSRAAELIQDVVGFIGRVPGTGVPCYDETLANKVRAMGIPCFCCTPTLLPEFRAGALKGANLEQLAARLVKPEK